MGNKIAYTMRIDEDIYEKAKLVAESELRSVNNLIEFLLLKRIQEFEASQNQNSLTQGAPEDK